MSGADPVCSFKPNTFLLKIILSEKPSAQTKPATTSQPTHTHKHDDGKLGRVMNNLGINSPTLHVLLSFEMSNARASVHWGA